MSLMVFSSRLRLRTTMAVGAAGLILLADVSLGKLALTLLVRSGQPALESARAIERRYRVPHPYYHHDLLPNYEGPARWGPIRYTVRTNSVGFRDGRVRQVHAEAGVPRILLIGDSFTEGLGVEYDATVAGLLAATFAPDGIDVLNAAVASYSPAVYWKKIEDLLERRRLRFDAVIVFIDIADIYDEALAYRIDRTGRVVDAPEISWDVIGTWRLNSLTFRAVEKGVQTLYPHPPWIGCTHVEAERSLCRAAWTLSRVAMDRFGQDGLGRADEHMTRLAALLRAHRIPLTVAVYPWPHQIRWDDRSSVQVRHWSRWAEREEVRFIDLFVPFFAEVDLLGTTETIGRNFLSGDVHWAASGHRLVAETVVRQFVRPGKAAGG